MMASTDPETALSSLPAPVDATEPETPSFNFVSSPLFSTSSETKPSPDYALPPVWDVFISFHGKDTRDSFTSHAFRRLDGLGIHTYTDNQLRTGDVMWDELVKAIKNSKIHVIVFSKNYASSEWCLDEVVEIFKCHELTNRLVVGVYCNIEPTVVRRQSGSFKDSFKIHEDRVTEMEVKALTKNEKEKMEDLMAAKKQREKIKTWKSTLKKVTEISGLPISGERYSLVQFSILILNSNILLILFQNYTFSKLYNN